MKYFAMRKVLQNPVVYKLGNYSSRAQDSNFIRLLGIDVVRDPRTNRGTAFTVNERQLLGIHGLLPPSVLTLEQQVSKMLANLKNMNDNLQRYIYLTSLQDRNEALFYKLVIEHVEYCMPLIYTPTVGLACQRYGVVFRRPRGLYITIHDRHHIPEILNNWPEPIVKAIVFTDGERILGLGDLGAYGMGIPIGKLSLYTALAGVHPKHCLPILLDVGTDNQELLNDPFYTGIRHNRIRDERYDELIENFMQAIAERYGNQCLIQFEDFGNHNAFRLLERYQDSYCTFNDDIQGTAAVAVAGLLAASRITERKLSDNIYLFVGAGEAATGIAQLLATSLQLKGLDEKEALGRIYMFDKHGLLTHSRQEGSLTDHNKVFARNDMEHILKLEDAVQILRPTVIIGASGQGGIFTDSILRQMIKNSDRPIIFSLSNPTSKSECTAERAYRITEGRCVFASGSPFNDVALKISGMEVHFQPGQCNNSYIFPGMGLAITLCQIRPVLQELFVIAAECLADQVEEKDLNVGRVFPPLKNIRNVSLAIAVRVAEYAYSKGLCNRKPQPEDIELYLSKKMYDPNYIPCMPEVYDWPPGVIDTISSEL
ncbi:NADP-dependent malic enzyme [Schistosoma japonicum]|nr:NADP-dependent malic enzyme [Schistosoma japonicum]